MKEKALLLSGIVVIGLIAACIPTETKTPEDMEPAAAMEEEPTAPPLGFPGNPVSRNLEWEPVTEEFDGIEMALVPAGCFMMGTDGGHENESPSHEQCFEEPFWIDVYEVTKEQYGADVPGSKMNEPVNYIDWFEAVSHCQSRGGRLPTEAEWEYAARGPDSLEYPWRGDSLSTLYLVYGDQAQSDVGTKPLGVSWVGALDLSGSAVEWTSSIIRPYPYVSEDGRETDGDDDSESPRVTRGGGFMTRNKDKLRSASRQSRRPTDSNLTTGFRCAQSY